MAENRAVSHEIIDALEEGLKRLRVYDGRFQSPQPESIFWFATPHKLNFDNQRKSKAQNLEDDATLEGYNATLRRYRLASKALLQMSRSLDLEINRIESEIQPMVLARGITKIPDEVLALIMRSLYEPWNPIDYIKPRPEELRLVCKRFRDVFDSQPSLWSVLSSGMHPMEVSRRLDRLGTTVGLKIHLWDDHVNFCTFVDTLIPCASRWEEVYFVSGGSDDVEKKQAYLKLRDLSLPRLNRLITHPSYSERGESDHLFSMWKTPKLHEVVSYGSIPIGLDAKKTIKSFELIEESEMFMESSHLNQLSSFLSVAKSLTSLRLCIYELEDYNASSEGVAGIKLPHLEKLDLEFRFLEFDMIEDEMDRVDALGNALYKFISKLETPALEEIAVAVEHDPVWDELTEEFLTDLLRTQAKSMNLRRIEFTQRGLPLEMGSSGLLYILRNLHLEGIAIFSRIIISVGCTEHLAMNMSKEPPRNLRRLHFKDCSLSAEDVGALLKVLTKQTVFPKFEALVFTRCSGLKKDELRGMEGLEFVVFVDE